MPLKSRRMFPPGAFGYYEPRTGWQSPVGLDFDTTVNMIVQHRIANPRFAEQWSTDREVVADELDDYTCKRLNNDPQHCDDSPAPPFLKGLSSFPRRTSLSSQGVVVARAGENKVSAGIGVLKDWWGDDLKPVVKDLAERRASICADCPKNDKANIIERVLTIPAMEVVRKQIGIKHDMKLETSHDKQLNICSACLCYLPLKTWTPLKHILAHTTDAIRADLDPRCWILHNDQ